MRGPTGRLVSGRTGPGFVVFVCDVNRGRLGIFVGGGLDDLLRLNNLDNLELDLGELDDLRPRESGGPLADLATELPLPKGPPVVPIPT